MMKKYFAKCLCVLMVVMMLLSVCSVGISAATASAAAVLSEYVADFEDNYYSAASDDNCTSGAVIEDNGSKVLEVILKSSSQTDRFEIYNSSKGNLTIKDGKVYAVTVSYKVVQVGGDDTVANAPTSINLVRYTGSGNELVKVKSFSNSTYYPGDSTEWITSTVVFKAGIASSPEYNRLAINVISSSCPSIETNIESNMTKILFDNITVTECTEAAKSIEFISNGGSYCDTVLALSGESFELPTPTRDLYEFAGWYTDIELTKAFKKTAMPSSLSTKLYAKWDIAEDAVSVKFVTNNGTTVETAVGREGDALSLPTLTRANSNFAGWFDKEYTTRYTETTFPKESLTLYAKWEIIPQLITFDNVDDFPAPDNAAFTKRCLIGTDKYVTKSSKGYNSENALHYSFQRGYDLTGSAGKSTPAAVLLVDENGEKVKLTSGKTYVFTFKYKVVDYISSTGSITLIASNASGAWGQDRQEQDYRGKKDKTATIYYDESDEGKGWQTGKFTHEWNAKTDDGSYCFIAIGGEAEVLVDEILVYEYDKNFKAKTDKMMLCFDSGIAPIVDTVYADRDSEVTLPQLEMEGHRFLGWTYDEERLQPVESETITLDTMYTKMYADWFKIPPVVEEPEPEPEPEPVVQPEPQDGSNMLMYIIIAGAAVLVIAAVVIIVVIKKKKAKS